MITRRGELFLTSAIAIAAFGLMLDRTSIVLLGLTALTWFLLEWILFALRLRNVLRNLRIRRECDGRPLGEKALVAGRRASIRTRVELISSGSLGTITLVDRLPEQCNVEGSGRFHGILDSTKSASWDVTISTLSAGRLRWEGVRLELDDPQSFFFAWTFVRHPIEVAVLPSLSDLESGAVGRKRSNAVPMQGMHRHRRPGSGSELLDLRDYREGDPPRSIAWKLSARRDRLITKEYESETPIRCTIFLDSSSGLRLGAPGLTPFDRFVSLAASLSRRLTEIRDPIGLSIFNENRVDMLLPSSGRRHLYKLYARLADAAGRAPEPVSSPSPSTIAIAHDFCAEVYPDLMDRTRNSTAGVGFGFWQLLITIMLYILLFVIAGAGAIGAMLFFREGMPTYFRLLGLLCVPVGVIGSIWLIRSILKINTRPRYADVKVAKRLAAVIAAREQLGPGAISWLQHDGGALSAGAMRILAEHRVPFSPPLFDVLGNYQLIDPSKADRVTKLLLRAAAHGRDDEFFVLMIDVLALGDGWSDVLRAIKTVLARRHQLAVVFPWPEGLPAPDDSAWMGGAFTEADPLKLDERALHRLVRLLDLKQYYRAYMRVKRDLSRLRVPVICMTESDAVSRLLDRIESLRHARSWP